MLTVHTLGPALIKALGAPQHCTRLELRLAFDEVPTVTCEYYPTGDDGTIASLATLMTEYELAPRPKASAEFQACRAEVIGFDAWMRERTDAAHAEFMARKLPQ